MSSVLSSQQLTQQQKKRFLQCVSELHCDGEVCRRTICLIVTMPSSFSEHQLAQQPKERVIERLRITPNQICVKSAFCLALQTMV
jgi:hypothetical protein